MFEICVEETSRRSFVFNVRKIEYYIQSRRKSSNSDSINRRKANWIGYILRRNCVLRHIIEGKIEGKIINDGKMMRYM
jgi:hypothetical protein